MLKKNNLYIYTPASLACPLPFSPPIQYPHIIHMYYIYPPCVSPVYIRIKNKSPHTYTHQPRLHAPFYSLLIYFSHIIYTYINILYVSPPKNRISLKSIHQYICTPASLASPLPFSLHLYIYIHIYIYICCGNGLDHFAK